MENPVTWGKAEHVVQEALARVRRNEEQPHGQRRYGLSVARQITDALREAGLLKEDTDGPVH